MMNNARKKLVSHLTEIANGSFACQERTVGTQTPLHCATYIYDKQHPLNISATVLGTALASLMIQAGYRQAIEKHSQIKELYKEGLPLLRNEFIVSFNEDGVRAHIDIFSSNPALPKSLHEASARQIDLATDRILNQLRLTS